MSVTVVVAVYIPRWCDFAVLASFLVYFVCDCKVNDIALPVFEKKKSSGRSDLFLMAG